MLTGDFRSGSTEQRPRKNKNTFADDVDSGLINPMFLSKKIAYC